MALLQTRAFLERPPLSVDEGLQVQLHAVELKSEPLQVPAPAASVLLETGATLTRTGAVPTPGGAAAAAMWFDARPPQLVVEEDPVAPQLAEKAPVALAPAAPEPAQLMVQKEPAQLASEKAPVAPEQLMFEKAPVAPEQLMFEKAPVAPEQLMVEKAPVAPDSAQLAPEMAPVAPDSQLAPEKEPAQELVDMAADEPGLHGPPPDDDPVPGGHRGLDLEKLATVMAEAGVLLVGEICRRVWISGAVEASGVVGTSSTLATEAGSLGVLVFGFPMTLWLMHRCRGGKREGLLELPEKNPFAEGSALRDVAPEELADTLTSGLCVFETVGCALEHTGSQGTNETVLFRSLAINATGLAYTALGRPTSSGRWRVELLKPAIREPLVGPPREGHATPDTVLVGILPDQDVANAADELAGHWAFVSAARGRGFAYSPVGSAVRRGAETPCSPAEVDAVLELALDAPRRAFEVFCIPREEDALPELLCSFVGIRPGAYRLAVSLRSGGVRVTDVPERDA